MLVHLDKTRPRPQIRPWECGFNVTMAMNINILEEFLFLRRRMAECTQERSHDLAFAVDLDPDHVLGRSQLEPGSRSNDLRTVVTTNSGRLL